MTPPFTPGRRVKLKRGAAFETQAVRIGVIQESTYGAQSVWVSVKWESGLVNSYFKSDIIFVDEQEEVRMEEVVAVNEHGNPFKVGDKVRLKANRPNVQNWRIYESMEFDGERQVRYVEGKYVRLKGNSSDDGEGNYHFNFLEYADGKERIIAEKEEPIVFQKDEEVLLKTDSRFVKQMVGVGIIVNPNYDKSGGETWIKVKWENGYVHAYPMSHLRYASNDRRWRVTFLHSIGTILKTISIRAEDEQKALHNAEVYMFQHNISGVSSISVVAI